MQVAIAQVSEVDQTHARDVALEQGLRVAHKLGYARDRHRDVVLDVQSFFCLGQWNGLAHMPKLLGLGHAFGDHRIGDQTLLHRVFQQAFEHLTRVLG